jgi:hypothetical protein
MSAIHVDPLSPPNLHQRRRVPVGEMSRLASFFRLLDVSVHLRYHGRRQFLSASGRSTDKKAAEDAARAVMRREASRVTNKLQLKS